MQKPLVRLGSQTHTAAPNHPQTCIDNQNNLVGRDSDAVTDLPALGVSY